MKERAKDNEVNGQGKKGKRGVPRPHTGPIGLKPISVSRQSDCIQVINPDSSMALLSTRLQMPSQQQSITALWPVQNYTAW